MYHGDNDLGHHDDDDYVTTHDVCISIRILLAFMLIHLIPASTLDIYVYNWCLQRHGVYTNFGVYIYTCCLNVYELSTVILH